jgi:two-component system nitrate/nitrite response regulator NarL
MAAKDGRVRVFVADDHPLYREGVVRAIGDRPELELVGESGDGRESLEEILRLKPDVAVLDMRLPELDGIQILSALEREGIATKVLLLTAHTDSAIVYDALAAGAAGYLTKDAGRREICDAIGAIARGETRFSADLHHGLAQQIRKHRDNQGPALSPREREVLGLIAEGQSAPQIAEQLFLSPATVKTHLQNLYEKLGVSDRAAAVAEAMRRGLLE